VKPHTIHAGKGFALLSVSVAWSMALLGTLCVFVLGGMCSLLLAAFGMFSLPSCGGFPSVCIAMMG